MLKKLVKYGNSNALIIDKAILELLNIEEGSTIKIKTDGKSIIITPHEKTESEKINKTFTHNQARIEASVKESFKKYNDMDPNKQEELEQELNSLIEKYQELSLQLTKKPEYLEKLTQLAKTFDTTSPEYIEASKAIRNEFSPELMRIEEEFKTFENKTKSSTNKLTEQQHKAMELDFLKAHKKNNDIYKAYGELLNNPNYQHQAQLIAEKYATDKNSADFTREIDTLTDKYLPEFRQAQEELKAVAERYNK